jgi:hypothetical protein
MRYLYGDSAPFPLQYNFLQTLEVFVAAAARSAKLDAETRAIQDRVAGDAVMRARAVVAAEGYHQQLVRHIQGSVGQSTEPQVIEYARQVIDHGSRFIEDIKGGSVTTAEREQANARMEIDRRRAEIREALQGFLLRGRLAILESRVTMNLVDGANELSTVFTHPEGIVTSFTLSVAGAPSWQAPRKVSDFATGLDLMIGSRKSLFRRTVAAEAVHLDDYIVSGFDLTDDTAEIRLRRKLADPRDTFAFKLQRTDAEILAEVERLAEVDSEAAPPAMDKADREQLERLWQFIRADAAGVLAFKERLVSVTLDGQDLFEHNLVVPFVERLLRLLAPTVLEIARRSPNAGELSLKVESDEGKREEIYLKKDGLAAQIGALEAQEKALFAPLGLLGEDPTKNPPPTASVIVDPAVLSSRSGAGRT